MGLRPLYFLKFFHCVFVILFKAAKYHEYITRVTLLYERDNSELSHNQDNI